MHKKRFKFKISDDLSWVCCTRVNDNKMHLKYNYFPLERQGRVNRMKHCFAGDHNNIAPCTKCPKNVRKSFSKHLSEAENKNTTYKNK